MGDRNQIKAALDTGEQPHFLLLDVSDYDGVSDLGEGLFLDPI